jgi:hypothetical protein
MVHERECSRARENSKNKLGLHRGYAGKAPTAGDVRVTRPAFRHNVPPRFHTVQDAVSGHHIHEGMPYLPKGAPRSSSARAMRMPNVGVVQMQTTQMSTTREDLLVRSP